MATKVYMACKMTGLKASELSATVEKAEKAFKQFGIEVSSPWYWEKSHYKPTDTIMAKPGDLIKFWKRDKQAIEDAHIVVDLDGDRFSKGTSAETGFQRYGLMRPVVYVDTGYNSVRVLEGDMVVPTVEEAASLISQVWGTRIQRILWRLTNVWTPKKVWKRIIREARGWR